MQPKTCKRQVGGMIGVSSQRQVTRPSLCHRNDAQAHCGNDLEHPHHCTKGSKTRKSRPLTGSRESSATLDAAAVPCKAVSTTALPSASNLTHYAASRWFVWVQTASTAQALHISDGSKEAVRIRSKGDDAGPWGGSRALSHSCLALDKWTFCGYTFCASEYPAAANVHVGTEQVNMFIRNMTVVPQRLHNPDARPQF